MSAHVIHARAHNKHHLVALRTINRCGLAVLHTSVRSLAGYYARQGYFPVPIRSLVFHLLPDAADISASLWQGEVEAAGMLRSSRVDSLADNHVVVDELAFTYRQGTQRVLGCFSRAAEYWRSWVSEATRLGSGNRVRVVRSPNGECVGYGVTRLGGPPPWEGMLQVTEFFSSAHDDAGKRLCFLCFLAGELLASESKPTRLRVSPAIVNPMWLETLTVYPPMSSLVTGPVKDGATLVCSGCGDADSLCWHDEGQMFHIVGDGFAKRSAGACTVHKSLTTLEPFRVCAH